MWPLRDLRLKTELHLEWALYIGGSLIKSPLDRSIGSAPGIHLDDQIENFHQMIKVWLLRCAFASLVAMRLRNEN